MTEKLLDYNSRLKPMPRKGLCGDEEIIENEKNLEKKVKDLADLLRKKHNCVVFTGAGISTSAGIPDFRGPNGVWTRELRGNALREEEKTAEIFNVAKPTLTHYAIVKLVEAGYVKHVISQNVDGLHLRSGLSEEILSELHGNIFMEICSQCKRRYLRDYDVGGMGLKPTGRKCDDSNCQGALHDFAVDWDTNLPEDIFRHARKQLRTSEIVLCLGTSLRIRPAGNMPTAVLRKNKDRDHAGKLVVVNLQRTHLDQQSHIRIHHYTDSVMKKVCKYLNIDLSDYVCKGDNNISTCDTERSTISATDSVNTYNHNVVNTNSSKSGRKRKRVDIM
jgi:NAD+-dependent protein deacetylase sirtuin 6